MSAEITLSLFTVLSALPGILYALAGAYQGLQQGETFDAISFIKTCLISVVSAGVISQETSSNVTQFIGTPTMTLFLDQLANNLIARVKAVTTVTTTKTTTPVVTTTSAATLAAQKAAVVQLQAQLTAAQQALQETQTKTA